MTVPSEIDDPSAQLQRLTPVLNKPVVAGDVWHVISAKWLRMWKDYASMPLDRITHRPSRIDNHVLVYQRSSDSFELINGLTDRKDYELVPGEAWQLLVQWYGGGPAITRKAISLGLQDIVEVYPFTLFVQSGKQRTLTNKPVSISKAATVEELLTKAREVYNIPSQYECRIWSLLDYASEELLTDMGCTLHAAGLVTKQVVAIECRLPTSDWPASVTTTSFAYTPKSTVSNTSWSSSVSSSSTSPLPSSPSSASSVASTAAVANVSPAVVSMHSAPIVSSSMTASGAGGMRSNAGVCGLTNLGNTCFMNSALQCLSNTEPLCKYFLANRHRAELNTRNPLGCSGHLANEFGALMASLWKGDASSVAPRDFKLVLGRFASQFSGYQQHDSQELLAFLLDGLHEDVNRIINKPATEAVESDGKARDEEVAQEAWARHCLRNQSIIVDLFQGQFKSTLVCDVCEKTSITFDPFMYLSLPLPVMKSRAVSVIVVPLNGAVRPLKCEVSVPKSCRISELKEALCQTSVGSCASRLALADVYGSKVFKLLDEKTCVSDILPNDVIFAYETHEPCVMSEHVSSAYSLPFSSKNSASVLITVVHRKASSSMVFGTPLILCVSKSISGRGLRECIVERMRRFVDFAKFGDGPNDFDLEKFPCQLLYTDKNGYACSKCSSILRTCTGCPVPLSDDALAIKDNSIITLQWESQDYEDAFDPKEAEAVDLHPSAAAKEGAGNKGISLTDCLKLFTAREQLGPQDAWYCPNCKEHRQAFKKFDIWKLPEILVVHLKRFQMNSYYRDKLENLVDFPVEGLDMSSFVVNRSTAQQPYDLFAVSNHHGGLGGGHYTAMARNFSSGSWYDFNDSFVRETAASPVTKAAYVLFYRRRA